MSQLLKDTFIPVKALPAHITKDGMALVEQHSEKERSGNHLFLEIGTGRSDTLEPTLAACDAI